MKSILWFISFILLCIAAVVGLGVMIQALSAQWFIAVVLCIAGIYTTAGLADSIKE